MKAKFAGILILAATVIASCKKEDMVKKNSDEVKVRTMDDNLKPKGGENDPHPTTP